METGNLIHLGAELVVQMLMLYSTSPHARRLTSQMLTGDPFNIDVKLDMNSTNRNVEILNVYLKTMGLKLSFRRIPKQIIQPMVFYPMTYMNPYESTITPMVFMHKDEKFDIKAEVDRLLKTKDAIIPMEFYPMDFYEDPKEDKPEE